MSKYMLQNQVRPYTTVTCNLGHQCKTFYRSKTTPYGFPKDATTFDYVCNECMAGKYVDFEPCYHCDACNQYDVCHGCVWLSRKMKSEGR